MLYSTHEAFKNFTKPVAGRRRVSPAQAGGSIAAHTDQNCCTVEDLELNVMSKSLARQSRHYGGQSVAKSHQAWDGIGIAGPMLSHKLQ